MQGSTRDINIKAQNCIACSKKHKELNGQKAQETWGCISSEVIRIKFSIYLYVMILTCSVCSVRIKFYLE